LEGRARNLCKATSDRRGGCILWVEIGERATEPFLEELYFC
jgi:hypothetical protein